MNLMQVSFVQPSTAAGLDGAVVGVQLFEQAEVEARRARGLHVGPRCRVLGIEPDLDLLVLPSEHPLYHVEIDRCVHDLFPSFQGVLNKHTFLMVLSDDYTPKYTVAESRLIPLSLAAVRGAIGGFSHPPSGNSR